MFFPRVHLVQDSFRMLMLGLRQLGSCLRALKNLRDHPQHARLSALTDHLVWDCRHSTLLVCLWAVYTYRSSVECDCDSTKGTVWLSLTNGPCVHFCTPLANYWCLVGELRASVSQWSVGVSWEAHGLKCDWLTFACSGVTCSFSPSMDCLMSSLCIWGLDTYYWAVLMPSSDPTRKAQRFILVFVSTQASCFDTTFFFFLACWPASFLSSMVQKLHPAVMYLLSVLKVWFMETHCKETLRNGVFSLHTPLRTLKSLCFMGFPMPVGDIIWSLLKKVYRCLWYCFRTELSIRLVRCGERNPAGLCIPKKISLPWLCDYFFSFFFFPNKNPLKLPSSHSRFTSVLLKYFYLYKWRLEAFHIFFLSTRGFSQAISNNSKWKILNVGNHTSGRINISF